LPGDGYFARDRNLRVNDPALEVCVALGFAPIPATGGLRTALLPARPIRRRVFL